VGLYGDCLIFVVVAFCSCSTDLSIDIVIFISRYVAELFNYGSDSLLILPIWTGDDI